MLAGAAVAAAWADWRTGWITPAFDFVAHQFYEIPMLARIRRPSQLLLVREHLAIGTALAVLGLAMFARLGGHGRALASDLLGRLRDPGHGLDLWREPAAGARR